MRQIKTMLSPSSISSWAEIGAVAFTLLGAFSGLTYVLTSRPIRKQEAKEKLVMQGKVADAQREAALATENAGKANHLAGDANERAGLANRLAGEANERATKFEAEAEKARADIAKANDNAAQASKRAAEATEAAEREKIERLKLEAQIAPRRLTKGQQDLLVNRWKHRIAGKHVSITSYSLDAEGAILCKQLVETLRAAGLQVEDGTASFMPVGGFKLGVHVGGADEKTAKLLMEDLSRIGGLEMFPLTEPAITTGFRSGPSPSTLQLDVEIAVGVKPVK